jgi:hypothetical protein
MESNMGKILHPEIYFGPERGKLRIYYHNGAEIVPGYIVAQTGAIRYIVSDINSAAQQEVVLVQWMHGVEDMTAGYAFLKIILWDNSVEHVSKLLGATCFTAEQNNYGWSLDHTDQVGTGQIETI